MLPNASGVTALARLSLVRARRGSYLHLRRIGMSAVTVLAAWIVLGISKAYPMQRIAAGASQQLFVLLIVASAVLALGAGADFGTPTRLRTLQLLSLSAMTSLQIALGLWLGVVFRILLAASMAAPALLAMELVGGLDAGRLIRGFTSVLCASMVVTGLSLVVAPTAGRRRYAGVGLTALGAFGLVLLWRALALVAPGLGQTAGGFAPWAPLLGWTRGRFDLVAQVLQPLAGAVVVSAGLLWLAGWLLERRIVARGEQRRRGPATAPAAAAESSQVVAIQSSAVAIEAGPTELAEPAGPTELAAPATGRRPLVLGDEPLLDLPGGIAPVLARNVTGAVVAVGGLLAFASGQSAVVGIPLAVVLAIAALLCAAHGSWSWWRRVRESGFRTVLLSTPLTGSDFAKATAMAIWRPTRWPLLGAVLMSLLLAPSWGLPWGPIVAIGLGQAVWILYVGVLIGCVAMVQASLAAGSWYIEALLCWLIVGPLVNVAMMAMAGIGGLVHTALGVALGLAGVTLLVVWQWRSMARLPSKPASVLRQPILLVLVAFPALRQSLSMAGLAIGGSAPGWFLHGGASGPLVAGAVLLTVAYLGVAALLVRWLGRGFDVLMGRA